MNYPGALGHLGAISLDGGAIEKLHEIKQPRSYTVTSLAFDPAAGTLFYTADNTSWRDLMAFDVKTKRERMLLKDARIGELVFDKADRSLWGVRTFNGICTLVRIPYPYREWQSVYSWPYGETAYDLDLSADGTLASVSVGEIDGRQTLRVMQTSRLLDKDPTPVAQFDFGTAIPEGFIFSEDGRYLYGSSYYTGVSNIFATSSRPANWTRSRTRRPASSSRSKSVTARCSSSATPATDSFHRSSTRRRSTTSARSTSSASSSSRSIRSSSRGTPDRRCRARSSRCSPRPPRIARSDAFATSRSIRSWPVTRTASPTARAPHSRIHCS
jgi:hypothetical protein